MWPWVVGLAPEAVLFFKGLQADDTKAHWSAHTAFYEAAVREPMAALLDEMGGNSAGRIARPYRNVRSRAGKPPYKTAACSASCGRVDGRLDVHHRRPVDCLQRVDFNPEPVARHDAGTVQADGVRPIGRTGAEHAGKRLAHVVLGMRAQLIAERQVEPGKHHDLVARSQVLGTLCDLLIEADPRPRRAFALVRRIIEEPQGRLHPPDRHEAVARLHKNSVLVGRGHRARGCPDRSICTRPCRGSGLAKGEQIGRDPNPGTPDAGCRSLSDDPAPRGASDVTMASWPPGASSSPAHRRWRRAPRCCGLASPRWTAVSRRRRARRGSRSPSWPPRGRTAAPYCTRSARCWPAAGSWRPSPLLAQGQRPAA